MPVLQIASSIGIVLVWLLICLVVLFVLAVLARIVFRAYFEEKKRFLQGLGDASISDAPTMIQKLTSGIQ